MLPRPIDPSMFFRLSGVGRAARKLLLCVVLPVVLPVAATVFAQQTDRPAVQTQQPSDEQIAIGINNRMMASKQLQPLHLGVWVHDGIVTLSGAVPDADVRRQAIAFMQAQPGVKSVEDHLTIGPPAAGPPPPEDQQQFAPGSAGDNGQGQYGGNRENQNGADEGQPGEPYGAGPPPPMNGQQGPPPPPTNEQQGPPPPPMGYAGNSRPPLETIPQGTPIHVMMLRGITSRHTKPGTRFRAVVIEDVILLNGAMALPRGTYVDGSVIDARPPGHLKGHPELALQLNSAQVGDSHYPLTSSVWARRGPGKGGQTAGNTVGGAAGGAIIGGVVGGGGTAALGALLGGLGGLGLSSLSHGARLVVPAESVLTFYLNAPLTVREPTVNEIRSLAGNVPIRNHGPGYGPGYGPGPYYPGGYPPPPPPGPPGGYPY